ncbi:MAG: hypothetical protein V9G19_26150 [Tetrasphaera sp.]
MSIETVPDAHTADQAVRARRLRRIGLALFAVPVIAAAFGLFGPRTDRVQDSVGGYVLALDYPRASRSSIVTPFVLTVTKSGGFGDDPVVVRIDRAFLDHLDFQNWYPNPSAESSDGEQTVYEFDPPAGDTLRVSLDARTGPNQGFSSRTYAVALRGDDTPVAEVTFRTTFWP